MLLDEIINSLADDTKPLTGALLKTKILLHQLGAPELVAWVNAELNGYTNSEDLPPYRIVHGMVKANVSNMVTRYTDHPIPIMHLDEKAQENLERPELGMPIATMESLTQGKGSSVTRPIPMEFNFKLGEKLGNSFQVESAWIEIAKPAVIGILSAFVTRRTANDNQWYRSK
jgi:AbiTii